MILVAAVLLLVAVGLLAAGLAQGSSTLQWGSFAASALAALVLGLGELRRRQRPGGRDASAAGPPPEGVRPPGTRLVAPPPVPPSSPSIPRVEGPVRYSAGMATSGLGELAARGHSGAMGAPASPPATRASGTGAHSAVDIPINGSPSDGTMPESAPATPALGPDGEVPLEAVEVTDLLLVLDLTDEVLVVDEHPRYHLAGCPHLAGAETIPLPMDEARTDGFTPCGTCAPDRHLAERERARRAR